MAKLCNGNNHSPNCTCAFRGGHHSSNGVIWDDKWQESLPAATWSKGEKEFCRKTKCPVCTKIVHFVRHNGGSVWFDKLGHPWPKHGCFDQHRTSSDKPPTIPFSKIRNLNAVKEAAEIVLRAMEDGLTYDEILLTEAGQLVKAYNKGFDTVQKRLRNAQAYELACEEYGHLFDVYQPEFRTTLEATAETSKRVGVAQLLRINAKGRTDIQRFVSNEEAAHHFTQLRGLLLQGNVKKSGIGFAVIYSDGFYAILRLPAPTSSTEVVEYREKFLKISKDRNG